MTFYDRSNTRADCRENHFRNFETSVLKLFFTKCCFLLNTKARKEIAILGLGAAGIVYVAHLQMSAVQIEPLVTVVFKIKSFYAIFKELSDTLC